MTPMSKSLEAKIAKQRQFAAHELPKARLCAAVVLAVTRSESEFDSAIVALKAGLGPNWSCATAFQFMSGRQALFAAECGLPDEQPLLLAAQHLAEMVCNQVAISNLHFSDLHAVAVGLASSPLQAASPPSC